MSEIALPQRLTLLLDESSLNRVQRWLWVLSTGGTLLDGYVIFPLGVAIPIIIADFHIQPDVVGLVGASLVFGAVIGAGVGGPMADHLGRRKLMLADMMIIAAGACISALAKGPAMRSWNCVGCKSAGSGRYLNPRTRVHRVATLPNSRDGSGK